MQENPINKPFVCLLGVRIDLVDYEKALRLIKDSILKQSLGNYICVCPVHPLMVSRNDEELRKAFDNSFLTVPDGMPVVWASRMLGGEISDRVYGPNLMLKTCEMAEKESFSIYLYGGKPVTLENLSDRLLLQFPNLKIAGLYSPPFRNLCLDEEINIMKQIRSTSPDILFIGLGAPKQEKWMANKCSQIGVPISIGVGAAFDFLSGVKKQAPYWMQRVGLEWVFRLFSEPKRLWHRYLIYNPLFILCFVGQIISTLIGNRKGIGYVRVNKLRVTKR